MLLLACLLPFCTSVMGLGKYVPHMLDTEEPVAAEDPPKTDQVDDELQIEVAAAILLAGLFVFFIMVYTMILKCWKYRWNKRKLAESDFDSESSTGCSCSVQYCLEPIDLDKLRDKFAAVKR